VKAWPQVTPTATALQGQQRVFTLTSPQTRNARERVWVHDEHSNRPARREGLDPNRTVLPLVLHPARSSEPLWHVPLSQFAIWKGTLKVDHAGCYKYVIDQSGSGRMTVTVGSLTVSRGFTCFKKHMNEQRKPKRLL
jgi:hypothetical protein